MKPRWRVDGVRLWLWVIPALGALAAVNMALDVGRPFGGYLSDYNTGNGKYYLMASPPWWPTMPGRGGELVTLAGQSYSSAEAQWFEQAYARGETTLEVTRDFWGEISVAHMPIAPFALADFLDLRLTPILLGLVFWLVAVVIYRDAPHMPLNRSFALVCIMAAGQQWLQRPGLFLQSGWLTPQLVIASKLTVTAWVGACFANFALVFPRPLIAHAEWRRWLTAALYGLGAVLMMGYGLSAFALSQGRLWARLWEEWAFNLTIYLTLGGLAVLLLRGMAFLLSGPAAGLTRTQVWVMWLGWASAAPVVALNAANFLGWLDQFQGFIGYWDARYLYLGIPLALAFLVLRHQAYAAVSRDYLYLLVLAFSAALAGLGDALLRALHQGPFHLPPALPLFGLLLGSSLFWVRQLSQRGMFGRGVNWEAYGYDAVQRVTHAFAGQGDLTQFPQAVPEVLVSHLMLESAVLYRWEPLAGAFHRAAHAGAWATPPPDSLPAPSAGLRDWPAPLRVNHTTPQWPWWLEPLCRHPEVQALSRLWVPDPETPLGLLAIGKRRDEEYFDDRDLAVLRLIAQQVSLALLAARQLEERQHALEWAAEAKERERLRIARDLHDTVQQFFGALVYALDNSRALLRSQPEAAEQLLQDSAREAQAADAELRQILGDLTAEQVRQGLAQPLTTYIENFRRRTGLAVALTLPPEAGAALSSNARQAVYRVIGQALDNVARHAGAARVTITLAETDQRLHFVVADDGRGFENGEAAVAGGDGHYGLRFMLNRLREWGGELTVLSAPGQGTRIAGWLPLNTPAPEP